MRFDVITLLPELVTSVVEQGVVGRAEKKGIINLHCWNPRDFTEDVHRTVDDRPYGGGPGMVLKADCLLKTIREVKQYNLGKVVYLSPQGKQIDQALFETSVDKSDTSRKDLILLCGRYEGIDERVIDLIVDEEWSLGDYVLSGGELGAMVIIDAMTRLLSGTLGDECSAAQDSFEGDRLDYPHYTRPEIVEDIEIPDVLKSGNHQEITKWRQQQALLRTIERRPDLIEKMPLSDAEQKLLKANRDELK